MCFALESDLVRAFSEAVSDFVRTPGYTVHRFEMNVGARIADIVATGFVDPIDADMQLLDLFRRVRRHDLFFLAHLMSGRALTVQTLSRRAHVDLQSMQERMERLRRAGAVETTTTGKSYRLAEVFQRVPDEVVAFEAKLSDWKKAVQQASDYAEYADRAWVVMPATQAANEELRQACANAGVGLVLVGGDGSVQRDIRPRSNQGRLLFQREMKLRTLWEFANHPQEFKRHVRASRQPTRC